MIGFTAMHFPAHTEHKSVIFVRPCNVGKLNTVSTFYKFFRNSHDFKYIYIYIYIYICIYICIYKKVKCCRYRPGVAQREGRGIALLFHDRGTRSG